MASASEAVRRLSIKAETVGVDRATAQLNKLSDAQSGVAVASSSTEKATLSLDKSFSNIERRYVASVRAQQDYEKTQRIVNQAVSQNPALQERANVVLAAAKDRHDQLTNSQKALSVVSQDLNSRIQSAAGSFGIAGQALSALGPVGVAAAATIGSLAVSFYAASAAAHELAQKSRELKDFSESTGLTVSEVQALRSEANKFGVDSDTLQAGLQKFTTGFQDLRLGSGDLLTQIRRINPALADQMAQATNTADAFTLYGKAVQQTTNIFERNALARAGLGKGGPAVAQFLGSVGDVAALGQAFDTAGRGLQKSLIEKTAELDTQIASTTRKARQNVASIFAEDVLKSELAFANGLLKMSEYAQQFKLSDDMNKFIGFLTNPLTLTALAALAAVGAVAAGPLTIGGGALAVGAGLLGAGAATSAVSGLGASTSAAGGSPTRIQIPTDNLGTPGGTAARTPQFDVATERTRIALLGDAATASERLRLKIAELQLGQDGYKLSTESVNGKISDYDRAIRSINLDAAISQQSALISALGGPKSAAELLLKARQANDNQKPPARSVACQR